MPKDKGWNCEKKIEKNLPDSDLWLKKPLLKNPGFWPLVLKSVIIL